MRLRGQGVTEDADPTAGAERARFSSTMRGSTPTSPLGHHPERPERLVAARAGVQAAAGTSFERVTAQSATDEELARVHDPRFIDALAQAPRRVGLPRSRHLRVRAERRRRAPRRRLARGDGRRHDRRPHRQGGGAAATPRAPRRPARAMGFCLLNNVAVAAAHARARGIRARRGRRLGRPPRQRHAGDVLARRLGPLPLDAPVSFLPGNGRPRRGRRGRRARVTPSTCRSRPAAATPCTRARSSASFCRSSRPTRPSWSS